MARRARLSLPIAMAALVASAGCSARSGNPARIATGYISHVLCSYVFVSGLDPAWVSKDDIADNPVFWGSNWTLHHEVDRDRREVTARVLGGFETRANVFNLSDVGQELRELIYTRRDLIYLFVMVRDHSGTGSGRHDDVLGIAEDIDKVARHLSGLFAISGVKRRLPATGLGFREVNLITDALQDAGHRETDIREDLIDNAGDE